MLVDIYFFIFLFIYWFICLGQYTLIKSQTVNEPDPSAVPGQMLKVTLIIEERIKSILKKVRNIE